MNNINRIKAEQLGMPFGTAMAKLRKKILFSLLKKYSEDICYRCGSKIEFIDELSIEHKKSWFKINTELFWDLENIAFSHLLCNINARNKKGGGYKIYSPKGISWCGVCKINKSCELFSINNGKNGRNGLSRECKDCRKLRTVPTA